MLQPLDEFIACFFERPSPYICPNEDRRVVGGRSISPVDPPPRNEVGITGPHIPFLIPLTMTAFAFDHVDKLIGLVTEVLFVSRSSPDDYFEEDRRLAAHGFFAEQPI